MYDIGDKVKIVSSNDNECYDDFRNDVLIVTHIATNVEDHPGYDTGMEGEQLMDFVTEDDVSVPFSLYEYEIEYA
jgi:hypothetical protein